MNAHFEDIATTLPAIITNSLDIKKNVKDIIINTANKKITQKCA